MGERLVWRGSKKPTYYVDLEGEASGWRFLAIIDPVSAEFLEWKVVRTRKRARWQGRFDRRIRTAQRRQDAIILMRRHPRFQSDVTTLKKPKKNGGRGRSVSKDFLAALAVAYHGFVRAGSVKPTREVAKAFGLSRYNARWLIHRCRKEEYLSATTQGQYGGQATPKARRIVRKKED